MSLRTFVFVHNNTVISPALTTIRDYGRWFEDTFDEYTAAAELYMSSVKKNGERVLESHPGTKIGSFFDKTTIVNNSSLISWYVMKDSEPIKKIMKLGMAEARDTIPVSINFDEKRQMIRLYTVDQIEFYIRSTMDTKFLISSYCLPPKQIKVTDAGMEKIIFPKLRQKRTKSLF